VVMRVWIAPYERAGPEILDGRISGFSA